MERDLDLILKLGHVGEFPGCPHFTWDNSRVELEMQILWLLFALESHAPCATERQCLYPEAEFQSCCDRIDPNSFISFVRMLTVSEVQPNLTYRVTIMHIAHVHELSE